MGTVYLITGRNHLYKEKLIREGCTVIEVPPPAGSVPATAMETAAGESAALIEVPEESQEGIEALVSRLPANVRLVATAARPSEPVRSFLLRSGIADLFDPGDADGITGALAGEYGKAGQSIGSMMVCDDHSPGRSILFSLIARFRYTPVMVHGTEELFEALGGASPHCVLLNLGTQGFDISSFIKRSHASPVIKKQPLIPYKNRTEDILIHELTSGLKKFCRVILSTEELLGFLADTLFRMELGRELAGLARAASPEEMQRCAAQSFGPYYNQLHGDLFSQPVMLNGKTLDGVLAGAAALRETARKARGISWMVRDAAEGRATCGPGGGR